MTKPKITIPSPLDLAWAKAKTDCLVSKAMGNTRQPVIAPAMAEELRKLLTQIEDLHRDINSPKKGKKQ